MPEPLIAAGIATAGFLFGAFVYNIGRLHERRDVVRYLYRRADKGEPGWRRAAAGIESRNHVR